MNWLGAPAVAFVLGAFVMSGTAKGLDAGWRGSQPETPVPSVNRFGKRQLDGASQNFNWSLVRTLPIAIFTSSLLLYRLIHPQASPGHSAMEIFSVQGLR